MENEFLKYVGVNDTKIDMFEGQYPVKNGMSYNSYVLLDEKIVVFDSVEEDFGEEWLNKIDKVLNGKEPYYFVISHMEPDHSGSIDSFIKKYPSVKVIGNLLTFNLLKQFFPDLNGKVNALIVKETDVISTGKFTLSFYFAPMVHWPEVMMTYIKELKTIFTADAFGKFGSLLVNEPWIDEARKYYMCIVAKYGLFVQNLLKKISGLEIERICSLHGPVIEENIKYYLNKYNIWSSYQVEEPGILIAFTSIYGHTKKAAFLLKEKLEKLGVKNIFIYDISRSDTYEVLMRAFMISTIVFASTTYNASLFPAMEHFLGALTERNLQNKNIAIIQNGSWGPIVASEIKHKFAQSKNINWIEPNVTIISALNNSSLSALEALADSIVKL